MPGLQFPRDTETSLYRRDVVRRAELRAAKDAAERRALESAAQAAQDAEDRRQAILAARRARVTPDQLVVISQIVECHADAHGVTVEEILLTRGNARIEAVQDSVIWHMRREGLGFNVIMAAMGMGWASIRAAYARHQARGQV